MIGAALLIAVLALAASALGGASLVGGALGTAPASAAKVFGAAYVVLHLAFVVLVPPLCIGAVLVMALGSEPVPKDRREPKA